MKDLCLRGLPFLEDAVEQENYRQLSKWGIQDHLASEWLMFTVEELGETAKAISEWKCRRGDAEEVVKEAIQTAILTLKIAEMFQDLVKRSEREDD